MLSLILVTVSHGGGGRYGSGELGVFYYGEDPKGMAFSVTMDGAPEHGEIVDSLFW